MPTYDLKDSIYLPDYIVRAVKFMVEDGRYMGAEQAEELLKSYALDCGGKTLTYTQAGEIINTIVPAPMSQTPYLDKIINTPAVERSIPDYYPNACWSDDVLFDPYGPAAFSPYSDEDYDRQTEWKTKARDGQLIDAIKAYRALHSNKVGVNPVGLKEAKDAVESWINAGKGQSARYLLVWTD